MKEDLYKSFKNFEKILEGEENTISSGLIFYPPPIKK